MDALPIMSDLGKAAQLLHHRSDSNSLSGPNVLGWSTVVAFYSHPGIGVLLTALLIPYDEAGPRPKSRLAYRGRTHITSVAACCLPPHPFGSVT
jgi:hypothetical protein